MVISMFWMFWCPKGDCSHGQLRASPGGSLSGADTVKLERVGTEHDPGDRGIPAPAHDLS